MNSNYNKPFIAWVFVSNEGWLDLGGYDTLQEAQERAEKCENESTCHYGWLVTGPILAKSQKTVLL
jgi:hypothetical protein